MNDPRHTLELFVDEVDGCPVLKSPGVGWFTCAENQGQVLVPGAIAGYLRCLDVSYALEVPAGVHALIGSRRPERVHEPVAYGDVLYELAPLDAEVGLPGASGQADDATVGLIFRAPYSGRFWHRPTPKDAPLVAVGDTLVEGTVIGLIEVMKTFTHVSYTPTGGLPTRAKVLRLCAADGAEVADGDPLLELEAV